MMKNMRQKAVTAGKPFQTALKRLHNRSARPALDAGVLLSSSSLPIRLRGLGRPMSLSTCLAEDEAGRVLAFGPQAEQMQGRAPADVCLFRPISQGRITDLDGSRFLMEKLLRGSRHGVIMGPRVMVGVASHLSPLERKTVEEVTKAAGGRKVSLVDVCLLGVLGAGRDPFSSGELVVDLGAGHGEVALVSRGHIPHVRTIPGAGTRMDAAIEQMVMERYGLKISVRQAERVKLEVASAYGEPAATTATVSGCDAVSGLPRTCEIKAEDVRDAIDPMLIEIAKEIRQVLKDAPPQLVGDVANHRALLIGGGANLPGLAEYLERETHLSYHVPPQPELVAQRGIDRALAEPTIRRRLITDGKVSMAPSSRGRLTEQLIGLAAVAMLLFGSYFPSEKAGSLKPLTQMADHMAPLWASLKAPFQPTVEAQSQQAQANEKERQLRQLAEENKTLRRLAKQPKASNPSWASGPTLSARVVARASQSWNEQIVIDVGSKQGVVPGMTAVSSQGLVGRVQSVSKGSAKVALISSGATEVGGRVQRTKSAGVIRKGQGSHLEIHFLDPDDGIKPGDVVVTSGLDGVYPAGIPVGQVERVFRPDNEVYLAAKLKPLLDLDNLDAVLLVGGQQV